jgi:hypothetical protein
VHATVGRERRRTPARREENKGGGGLVVLHATANVPSGLAVEWCQAGALLQAWCSAGRYAGMGGRFVIKEVTVN